MYQLRSYPLHGEQNDVLIPSGCFLCRVVDGEPTIFLLTEDDAPLVNRRFILARGDASVSAGRPTLSDVIVSGDGVRYIVEVDHPANNPLKAVD